MTGQLITQSKDSVEEYKANLRLRREKFVKALIKDEYPRGEHYLHSGGKYSIWGIACAIYQMDRGDLKLLKTEECTLFDGSKFTLPNRVSIYFGIPEQTQNYINFLISEKNVDIDDIVIELMEKFELIDKPRTRADWYLDYYD